MKKTIFLISLLIIISLTGCKATSGINSSYYEYEQYEVVKDNSTSQTTFARPKKTEKHTDRTISSSENTEKIESTVNSTESTTENKIEEIAEAKTFTVNGTVYTANFVETRDKARYIDYNKKTNVYHTDDLALRLEYDYDTDELLYINVETEEPATRISEDEARKIAEKFMTAHTDITSYKFADVYVDESISIYSVVYSKRIDGYHSAQSIDVSVSFDGNIENYYNNKHTFDGIDTNVKVNIKKLNKRLDKKIKEIFGNDVKYNAYDKIIDLDDQNNLAMFYSADILEKNTETGEEKYRNCICTVSLKGDYISIYGT